MLEKGIREADRRDTGNMKGSFAVNSKCGKKPLILAGAEMDFETAPVIVEAVTRFAAKGIYGFTLADDRYLSAVAGWLQDVRGMKVTDGDIVPTLGTIFGLSTAIRAFTRPGDGVVILHPSYYRHDRAVVRNGRRVISVPLHYADLQYTIPWERLKEAMQEGKMLILCNPHNPTGRVFRKSELERLAAIAKETGTVIFSDEIFAEMILSGEPAVPMTNVLPQQSVVCTSLGKAFNFTGVNHANAVITDPDLREKYIRQRNRDHFGSIDPFFYQAVLAGYSKEGKRWIRAVAGKVKYNAEMLERQISECPGMQMCMPEGGFIAWLDTTGTGMTGDVLAERLREEEAVLVDPGSEYNPGGEHFLRINLATPEKNIREFGERLQAVRAGGEGHASN